MDQSVWILMISSVRLDTLSMRKYERCNNDECLVKTVLNAYPRGDKRAAGRESNHRTASQHGNLRRTGRQRTNQADAM